MSDRDYTRFIDQNPYFEIDLTEDDRETVWEHAEHHSGGLIVLTRPLENGWYVKAHDTWGPGTPDEPGNIVVHLYHPEREEDPQEKVQHFDSGREAIESFMATTAPTSGPTEEQFTELQP